MTFANLFRACLLLCLAPLALAQDEPLPVVAGVEAPNVVVVSDTLVTAGQPTEASLSTLGKHGYDAVVYLAPPTVPDAVANEADLVRAQGLSFVNIPIQWMTPAESDFDSFVATMRGLHGKKVLVHCQANMRASAITFLYRVIEMKEDPVVAYKTLLEVWTPKGQWRDFVNAQLKKAGVDFAIE
jgi:protein tyrosine phosphatase (PTP) superfamily phosphohydrolase (DUF442 family)